MPSYIVMFNSDWPQASRLLPIGQPLDDHDEAVQIARSLVVARYPFEWREENDRWQPTFSGNLMAGPHADFVLARIDKLSTDRELVQLRLDSAERDILRAQERLAALIAHRDDLKDCLA